MKIKLFILTLIIGLNLLPKAWAGDQNLENFKKIPVLQEGRVKPLDTYARDLLLQFSGRESYEGSSAIEWLAKLLFAPQQTFNDKVILVNDPEIAVALNIKPESSRRYSFAEFQGTYNKLEQLKDEANNIDEHQRSLAENEIIRVAQNLELYADLTNEFTWAFADNDFTITSAKTKEQLGFPANQNQFSFYDLATNAQKIKDLAMLMKNNDQANKGVVDQELMVAVNNMFRWSQTYKNLPFEVIPQGDDWSSTWDAINNNFADDKVYKLIGLWHQMASDYESGDFIGFDISTQQYVQAVNEDLTPQQLKTVHKFSLEIVYHAWMPFVWARIFYILAFIFFIVSFASPSKLWYNLGLMAIVLGFIPHTFGLVSRIIIMGRPPVTSLYETFIFVGFISVLLGLFIEYYNRQWLGIVTAAICGTILLFIAGRYSAEGDTLKMLVAVLNSNFWLATHVTTITMGYSATCVAGILGHIWLIQSALGKKQEVLQKTYQTTLGIMGVALTLTFLGTNLGGIWADQSWGRFWGWDPKENGALMIVLWLTILFHAKFAQMIDSLGLAVGCVIGMMVVMWAWFGVNLLSIGLHSYGFTSGIANSLIVYAFFEVLFLILTVTATLNRRKA